MKVWIAAMLSVFAIAPASAEVCDHEQQIAFFEEQGRQADRCRIEMQVYREEGAECAVFHSSRTEGDIALSCLKLEVDMAGATGDMSIVDRVLPRYQAAIEAMKPAVAKMKAARGSLPQ